MNYNKLLWNLRKKLFTYEDELMQNKCSKLIGKVLKITLTSEEHLKHVAKIHQANDERLLRKTN
jgi:hypothetical protein